MSDLKVVLLRVGIDSGAGGIAGPLFRDGSFEFISIPDGFNLDDRKYGNSKGRAGRTLTEYFPAGRRRQIADQSMHVDPEFESYTYGDPTPPKRGLRRLSRGDLLVFYAGLEPWPHLEGEAPEPSLYLVGYFEVEVAGLAGDFADDELRRRFSNNFHVRHSRVFAEQRDRLVLVQGGPGSRLLRRARKISEISRDSAGRPLKVLSQEMRLVFGDFGGHVSIQRSPPRSVAPEYVAGAAAFIRSLE